MKKISLFIALTLLSIFSLSAQISITGTVTDEKSQPVGFAGVALVAAADSQLVKGALSDTTGAFSIADVPSGEYRLLTSAVSSQWPMNVAVQFSLPLRCSSVTISRIAPSSRLDEGKICLPNSWDIDRTGVLVVQDRVTLAGNSNVSIWIDGKASQYADMNAVLRDMPGDQIDRVKLITQPGAKFDATGGTIINIILKRNANLGFNGTAALTLGGSTYDQSDAGTDDRNYHRLSPSLSLNYRKGQWNLFGSYSYFERTNFNFINVDRFIGQESYFQKGYSPDESQSPGEPPGLSAAKSFCIFYRLVDIHARQSAATAGNIQQRPVYCHL